ncbi:hypothetical protein BH11ARM2_BH11ARM2_24310 [soil metagenome]
MRRTSLSILCLAALAPGFASAQQFDDGGGSSSKAWSDFKLNPKTRLKLGFRNAGIDSILQLYQKQSGVTIVKDPNLNDKFTLTSATPVSLNDAFQILATTLSLKGYSLLKEGKLLVIKKQDQNRGGNPFPGGFDPSSLLKGQDTELKVYPIKFANASQLARVVNEVFQQNGGGFPNFGGGGGGNRFGGGGGGQQRFGGGQGGFNPAALGRQQGPQVKASSDDFSNSLIINAPHDQQDEVARIIRELDKKTDEPIASKVYKLTYASASDLQPVVQSLLNGNAPKGRGGANNQTSSNPFFQIRAAFGGSAAGSGQVTADDRSNTLVVTATDDNQAIVEKVIRELDTEVKLQSSTFVFQLSNARADDVATLLNQAFGTRSGTNSNANRTGTNRNTNTNQNRNNQNRNNNGGNRLGGQNDVDQQIAQSSLPIALKDPNAESGELETNVAVAQAFGGGFFGGQNRNNNRGGTQQGTARDAQGRVINVNDLTNQVTTIADPNTNSVIVVTTPENAKIIQDILEQLDKIPEQVMIETLIVEASLDKSSKLGVEFSYAGSKLLGQPGTTGAATTTFPDTSATANTGFKFTTTGGNLSAIINALQTDDRFSVLSTPRIFTSNNVQAEINISQQVPYVVNQRADANGNILFTYDFQNVGIILTVTPRITSNGYVSMDITQTANELQGYTSFNAPIVNQREANTQVSVKDGETVILGGIIRNTVTSSVHKVPLLGDIPILGNLFKTTTKDNAKTELLVFLTPRIVHDSDDAALLKERSVKQLSPAVQKDIQNALPPGTGAPQVVPPATVPPKTGNGNGK